MALHSHHHHRHPVWINRSYLNRREGDESTSNSNLNSIFCSSWPPPPQVCKIWWRWGCWPGRSGEGIQREDSGGIASTGVSSRVGVLTPFFPHIPQTHLPWCKLGVAWEEETEKQTGRTKMQWRLPAACNIRLPGPLGCREKWASGPKLQVTHWLPALRTGAWGPEGPDFNS